MPKENIIHFTKRPEGQAETIVNLTRAKHKFSYPDSINKHDHRYTINDYHYQLMTIKYFISDK